MIVFVAGQAQRLSYHIFSQAEGAGAIGFANPILPAAHIFLIQDKAGGIGQLGQEVGFGGVNSEGHGAVVNDPHAGDLAGSSLQLAGDADNIAQVLVDHRGKGIRVGYPLQGPFDILSGNCLAIVKAGLRAQGESVGSTVRADFPAFRQVQVHGKTERVNRYQSAKYLVDQQAGTGVLGQVGIQSGRVGKEQPQSAAIGSGAIAAVGRPGTGNKIAAAAAGIGNRRGRSPGAAGRRSGQRHGGRHRRRSRRGDGGYAAAHSILRRVRNRRGRNGSHGFHRGRHFRRRFRGGRIPAASRQKKTRQSREYQSFPTHTQPSRQVPRMDENG